MRAGVVIDVVVLGIHHGSDDDDNNDNDDEGGGVGWKEMMDWDWCEGGGLVDR